jgi:beta-lactamase class A
VTLDDAWRAALEPRVPFASWSVRVGDEVLASHRPERMYSSASMVKTFLLAAALAGRDAGEPVAVTRAHVAPGDGVLRELTLPLVLPLRDVLMLMIAVSDNTATAAVLELLGGPSEVNAGLAAHGYATRVRPDPVDLGLPTPPGLGMTSLADHERVLGELLGGSRASTARALLRAQQDRGGLARRLSGEPPLAHKSGSVGRVRHDAGAWERGGELVFVGAFTDGGPEHEWVDHPALVGMGEAAADTATTLFGPAAVACPST